MKKLLLKHKNTIIGVVSLFFIVFLFVEYVMNDITFEQLCLYVGMVGGIVSTIVGIIAPDGKVSSSEEE